MASAAALAMDSPSAALGPVSGTSSATLFSRASGNGAGLGAATTGGGGAATTVGAFFGVEQAATSSPSPITPARTTCQPLPTRLLIAM